MAKSERQDRCAHLLEMVHVDPNRLAAYPFELSGGMRQRVMIAMALALEPQLIIMDEPTTALDVVVQREIIEEISELRRDKGFSVIFITHDLPMLLEITDKIAVMKDGVIVEQGVSEDVYFNPKHPYTQALISAIPEADPDYESQKEKTKLEGEVPSPLNPPSGCKFRTRCKYATERCAQEPPVFREVEPEHFVACHLFDKAGEK